uniref:Alpha/beta hydrolase fold-3 domain-containing protein n=1 Tax=Leptocylindrus danicus TaxID=163516 RepID=A0A7S2NSI6_9STRA|mmetsp:Transcript_10833/g.16306  ORF Transcript_10833/g.16306 Transcript_10833/m.16306 type:complete len:863 (+) Transcript_10833:661-3249(+)
MDWKSPTIKCKDHALEAAQLVDACCRRLAQIGHKDSSVADLAIVLASVERILHTHLLSLLEEASALSLFPEDQFSGGVFASFHDSSVMALAARLQVIHSHINMPNISRNDEGCSQERKIEQDSKIDDTEACTYTSGNSCAQQCVNPKVVRVTPRRSSSNICIGQTKEGGINSLLFHLVFALQICLVRFEEADAALSYSSHAAKKRSELLAEELCRKEFVLTKGVFRGSHIHATITALQHAHGQTSIPMPPSNFPAISEQAVEKRTIAGCGSNIKFQTNSRTRVGSKALFFGTISIVGGLGWIALTRYFSRDHNLNNIDASSSRRSVAQVATKVAGLSVAALLAKRKLLMAQIRSNLCGSASTLSIWQQKWIIAQSVVQHNKIRKAVSYDQLIVEPSSDHHDDILKAASRHLLERVPLQSSKNAFWYTHGALRFLLVRRLMDLLYATAGTTVTYINVNRTFGLWVPVAALTASYYAVAGAEVTSSRAAQVVSKPGADFIELAWGMVSHPVIKQCSLHYSRILKGAAVAEKIQLCGVNCFVISKKPFPELTSALERYRQRQAQKKQTFNDDETKQCEHFSVRPKRDVILHCTGGGWYTHTIAGDLIYLTDWSAATDAVVIIPEYDLLPEHSFPTAINQCTDVYCALVNSDVATTLGFETKGIIVSGESAGGNLAASICVRLCLDESSPSSTFRRFTTSNVRMPDALILGCPSLNMTQSASPSRVMGVGDPVLPTGLLYSISSAYLPAPIDRSDPIASPYFAPDDVLVQFPPTLLYTTPADPLLDDSVDFNNRLLRMGVNSIMRSVAHMPHAFWGLAAAGFPEVKEVHLECQQWLQEHFEAKGGDFSSTTSFVAFGSSEPTWYTE